MKSLLFLFVTTASLAVSAAETGMCLSDTDVSLMQQELNQDINWGGPGHHHGGPGRWPAPLPPPPQPPPQPYYPPQPRYGYWQCTAFDRFNRYYTMTGATPQLAASQALYVCGGPAFCYVPPNGCLYICN